MSHKLLDLINISKSYDDQMILDEMNLYIRENEFLTLLGPSGCGKTTTLRILGGFETPDSGRVMFDGKDITNVPPNKRALNTVFQKYALFPHMDVFENIAFGLKIKKMDKRFISIIPLNDEGIVISLTGFKYPLDHKYIEFSSTLGVSNEIKEEIGTIIIHEGEALVFESLEKSPRL